MLREILELNLDFKANIIYLKARSPLFPQVFKLYRGEDKVYLSTILRIDREGKWYRVHCVESCVLSDEYTLDKVYEKLIDSCYRIQQLHKITNIPGCEELDANQISEEDRLKLEVGLWAKL